MQMSLEYVHHARVNTKNTRESVYTDMHFIQVTVWVAFVILSLLPVKSTLYTRVMLIVCMFLALKHTPGVILLDSRRPRNDTQNAVTNVPSPSLCSRPRFCSRAKFPRIEQIARASERTCRPAATGRCRAGRSSSLMAKVPPERIDRFEKTTVRRLR